MFTDFVKIGDLEMMLDMDKDNSLADDVYAVLERAMDEEKGAAAAILSSLWLALHGNFTREVAEAIRPVMERRGEDSPMLLRETSI